MIKTNVKMRVTPEQSQKIQEICFANNIYWLFDVNDISHLSEPFLFISEGISFMFKDQEEFFLKNKNEEVSAELFIRTNGTCIEENISDIELAKDEISNFTNFIKADTNKIQPTLIDVEWYEDTCKVLTFGAEKYSKDNWKKCEDINRYIDALERHLIEVKKGNFTDNESGCSHLAHISCNAMFLHYFTRNK